ncbi:AarF/UbiB family protein [Streptomyces mirabilis]|uniref:AarF/UbiB family protein n=1 Tax=Streptomyces mirabilis TaxID=68239 RepID=UPI003BEF18D3
MTQPPGTPRRELDCCQEERTTDAVHRRFADDATVIIPRVHWPCTTRRALTMDLVEGQQPARGLTPRRREGAATRSPAGRRGPRGGPRGPRGQGLPAHDTAGRPLPAEPAPGGG